MTRRLILCEGPDDRAFFKALIAARGLSGLGFCVRHNGNKDNRAGGITQFRSGFKSWFEQLGGWRKLSDVLLVGDNDDHESVRTNFEIIRKQAHEYFGFSPNNPREFAKESGNRIMILMLPWDDTSGNLESLCIEAAKSADQLKAGFVDQFAAQVGVSRWQRESRKNEMWLRCNLAARCEDDPFVTLRDVFGSKKQQTRDLIPLNNSSFNNICDVLSSFSA